MKDILKTTDLNRKRGLQRLIGHLTTLGRFIARFIDKLRLFFLTLKGASMFRWTDECKQAFESVKHYLIEPPILSSPKSDEELYMYLAVFDYAISAILFWHVRDRE